MASPYDNGRAIRQTNNHTGFTVRIGNQSIEQRGICLAMVCKWFEQLAHAEAGKIAFGELFYLECRIMQRTMAADVRLAHHLDPALADDAQIDLAIDNLLKGLNPKLRQRLAAGGDIGRDEIPVFATAAQISVASAKAIFRPQGAERADNLRLSLRFPSGEGHSVGLHRDGKGDVFLLDPNFGCYRYPGIGLAIGDIESMLTGNFAGSYRAAQDGKWKLFAVTRRLDEAAPSP